jgi:hypothetical protein
MTQLSNWVVFCTFRLLKFPLAFNLIKNIKFELHGNSYILVEYPPRSWGIFLNLDDSLKLVLGNIFVDQCKKNMNEIFLVIYEVKNLIC